MLHLTDRVGILVEGEPYHLACVEQPDEGLERYHIYASTPQVQHWCCCGCGELLIDWEDNEELFGHEDGCTCETCILVSEIALTTSNLDLHRRLPQRAPSVPLASHFKHGTVC